jgi:hypothetical protein
MAGSLSNALFPQPSPLGPLAGAGVLEQETENPGPRVDLQNR